MPHRFRPGKLTTLTLCALAGTSLLLTVPAYAAPRATSPKTAETASVSAPAPTPIDVDDATTGTGDGQFSYSDGWSHCTACGSAGETVPLYDQSNSWSTTKGAVATFRFSGTAVTLYGVTHAKAGIASVAVDGGAAKQIDLYSAARKGNQEFFSDTGLKNAEHTVTVTVTGTHDDASAGTVVNLDRASYLDPDAPGQSVYTDVIPKPVASALADGPGFRLTSKSRIVVDAHDRAQGDYLAGVLRPATGFRLQVTRGHAHAGDVVLDVARGSAPKGHTAAGYTIDVDRTTTIAADTVDGIVNGIATFRQLLPDWIESTKTVDIPWTIPSGHVSDYPRFGYRGLMVDLSRAYMSPSQLKGIIDEEARLKFNELHLHLSDDPAWRIAISTPKHNPSGIDYDNLTAIGSHGGVITGFSADDPHPGHYTQAQYRDIVKYAKARGVSVIPEIDGPAHATSELASIPQLNASGTAAPIFIPTNGQRTYFDPTLPATKEFLTTVFDQLAAMTPGQYVHFGGDEAANMSQADYETYVSMAKSIITAAGKTPIGWNETAGTAGQGDVVQYWNGSLASTKAAADRGAKVIMSPVQNAYFDQQYAPHVPADAATWACPNGCGEKTAYNWNPVQGGLDESQVLGVEAATWGYAADKIDFLYNPRILATAEVGWTQQSARSYSDFEQRLGHFGTRLDAGDTNFYADPDIPWKAEIAPVPVCTRHNSVDGTIALASAPQITPKQALVMVDYGDGTPAVPALVTGAHSETNNQAHGIFTVSGSHHFRRGGTHTGSLTFTVGATGKTVKAPVTFSDSGCSGHPQRPGHGR